MDKTLIQREEEDRANDGAFHVNVDMTGASVYVWNFGGWIEVSEKLAYLGQELDLRPFTAKSERIWRNCTEIGC